MKKCILYLGIFICLLSQHLALDSLNYDGFDEDVWRLTANSFPEERFAPPIGNGHIATNVLSDTIYMNGFYSGYKEDSHRAMLQSTAAVNVKYTDGKDSRSYTLDMANGVFMQYIQHPTSNITITYFAHRKYRSLFVVHASGQQTDPSHITFIHNHGDSSRDISNFTEVEIDKNTKYWSGYNRITETTELQPMKCHQVWTYLGRISKNKVNSSRDIGRTWITSISSDKNEAFSFYRKAVDMEYEDLLRSHTKAWHNIWENGQIRIKGHNELSRNINAALYNILASLPTEQNDINPFIGLSPGGLSRGGKINPNKIGGPSNDYAGHVFWDMDTWILPPIMVFHPDLARMMIDSRIRVLDIARNNAKSSGYQGAKFPWEQAVTGVETCPWDLAAKYQIHVTADVSFALRQYLYVSTDIDAMHLLKQKGSALALDMARFWASRVSKSDNNGYDILDVMGPDEYHYNINNSVFTNYNAKLSLLLPSLINDKYQIYPSKYTSELAMFDKIAQNINILFNEKRQFHPQFESFNLKDTIKQSDVVLLGYPLLMSMNKDIRRNDLVIYENITDRFGPDTGTWSMHTVGWLELNEERKANDMFKMLLRNINGPFKVFSEKPSNSPDGPRCVNFITGAGGLLQAILFGYGGIRIHDSSLHIDPHLLPDVSEWTIKGLKYKGFVLDINIHKTYIQITLTTKSSHISSKSTLTIRTPKHDVTVLQVSKMEKFVRGKLTFQVEKQNKSTNNSDRLDSSCYMMVLLLSLSVLFTLVN